MRDTVSSPIRRFLSFGVLIIISILLFKVYKVLFFRVPYFGKPPNIKKVKRHDQRDVPQRLPSGNPRLGNLHHSYMAQPA